MLECPHALALVNERNKNCGGKNIYDKSTFGAITCVDSDSAKYDTEIMRSPFGSSLFNSAHLNQSKYKTYDSAYNQFDKVACLSR